MVEEQRHKLEQQMTNVITDLDKKYLRRIQRGMHACAINCCDNNSLSTEGVQNCISNCGRNLQAANNLVSNEFTQINNGLQRCVMDCNDEIRMKMGPNPSHADEEKYTDMFEKCATKCVDKFLGFVPSLVKNISAQLEVLKDSES